MPFSYQLHQEEIAPLMQPVAFMQGLCSRFQTVFPFKEKTQTTPPPTPPTLPPPQKKTTLVLRNWSSFHGAHG